MQNTYQEKTADLEVNNSNKTQKLEGGIKFKIKSDFQPSGDQPEAIKKLLKNLKGNKRASFARSYRVRKNFYYGKGNRKSKQTSFNFSSK